MLLERFGDEYRDYMARTGRVLPGVRHQQRQPNAGISLSTCVRLAWATRAGLPRTPLSLIWQRAVRARSASRTWMRGPIRNPLIAGVPPCREGPEMSRPLGPRSGEAAAQGEERP